MSGMRGSNSLEEESLDDIDLAEYVFLQYGQANSSDSLKRPPPYVSDINSPDGKLKSHIERLEESKYKPPLHCEIKTLENGQRVKFIIQAKPSEEGDLKNFPIDTKESLQIRLLHRARAAIKLMEQRKPPVERQKIAQLERLVTKWVTEWNEKSNKKLENKIDTLEKSISPPFEGQAAELKQSIASLEADVTDLDGKIAKWADNIATLDAKKQPLELKDANKLSVNRSKLNRDKEDRKEIQLEIKQKQQALKAKEKEITSNKTKLEENKAELRGLQKQMLKENKQAFQDCLEKMTVFTAQACDANEFKAKPRATYNKVAKKLDQIEPFLTWEDGRTSSVWMTREMGKDGKEAVHFQMEDPYRSLTKEQKEEFTQVSRPAGVPSWFNRLPRILQQAYLKRVLTSKPPSWFNELSSDQKVCLTKIRDGEKLTVDEINSLKPLPSWFRDLPSVQRTYLEKMLAQNPDSLENVIPSTLRSIPGTANFTKIVAGTLEMNASGEPELTDILDTVRDSTAEPVGIKNKSDKQRIANQNIAQLVETCAQSKAKEYSQFWGVMGTEGKPITVPISIASLLSAAGAFDTLGFSGDDNNTRMILTKERAIQNLVAEGKYSQPINIGTEEKPNFVKFTFLGQNNQLSAVRRMHLGGNPKEIEEKNYDAALVQSFQKHLDGIISKEVLDAPVAMYALNTKLADIKDLKSVSEEDLDELDKLVKRLNTEKSSVTKKSLVEDYFLERLQQNNGGKLTKGMRQKASRQTKDFLVSSTALVKLIELNHTNFLGKADIVENTEHRNRQLFAASYLNLIVGKIHGVAASGCKSSNDRRGLERVHTEAMRRVLRDHGWMPAYDDKPERREIFLNEMVRIVKEGWVNEAVADNTPGAYGIKNEEKIPGFELWPKDLRAALEKDGFVDSNGYFSKLNKVGKKLNRFKGMGLNKDNELEEQIHKVDEAVANLAAAEDSIPPPPSSLPQENDEDIVPPPPSRPHPDDEPLPPPSTPHPDVLLDKAVKMAAAAENDLPPPPSEVVAETLQQQVRPLTDSKISLGERQVQTPPLSARVSTPPKTAVANPKARINITYDHDLIKKLGNFDALNKGPENSAMASRQQLMQIATQTNLNQTVVIDGLVKVYELNTKTQNTVSTTHKEPAAAKAAIYALGARDQKATSLTINGGTLEQRVAACEAAVELGFSSVRCRLEGALAGEPISSELAARIETVQSKIQIQPPLLPVGANWAGKSIIAHTNVKEMKAPGVELDANNQSGLGSENKSNRLGHF